MDSSFMILLPKFSHVSMKNYAKVELREHHSPKAFNFGVYLVLATDENIGTL